MSKVVARYFQKCDMCNQEVQLECNKAELGKAILPGYFIPSDGNRPTPELIPVHLCPACLKEMSEYLRDKYILNDVEYAGFQIIKMPPKEETNDKKQPEEAPGNRTQAEAAAALDMSQGVYSMMESGRAVLNKCELVKAMAYYDVPAEKIYPPDILRLCFGIDAAEKKRKPTSAMVKIPIALAERIDGLITEGLYLSRTDFVAAATREKLGGDSNGQNAQTGGMVSV